MDSNQESLFEAMTQINRRLGKEGADNGVESEADINEIRQLLQTCSIHEQSFREYTDHYQRLPLHYAAYLKIPQIC